MTVGCDGGSDLDPPDTNLEPVKSLNRRTCLECNERDGVLVCNNADCRIAVHKDCMSCAAYFDNDCNFYCPYCVYKHSLDEYRKARDRNILAKKALISFLDSKAARSTGAACIIKSLKRAKLEGVDLTYQKDFVRDRSLPTSEVLRKSDEIREAQSGKIGDERFSQYSLQDDSRMVMIDVPQVTLKSENLKIKRQKTAVDMEEICNGGVQRKETQSETRAKVEKNEGFGILGLNLGQAIETIKLEDDRGRGNFQSSGEMHRGQTIDSNISQEGTTSLESLKVKSDCDEQPSEIQNNESDVAKNMPECPKSAACHTRKHGTSGIHKETDFYFGKHEEAKDTEEACDVDIEEMQQQHFEVSNLSRKEDMLAANRTFIKGDDDACHVTPNLEGIGDTHCKSADIQGKQQKHDVTPTSKENVRVSYKELDTGDAPGLAPESHCMGYGIYSEQKSQTSAQSEIFHQPRKSSGSSKSDPVLNDEATHVKPMEKVDSSKIMQQTPVSVGRRKKLQWTIEEEEALKEGVEIFARTAKKNLPWTKILEFGSHVFDGTRTPVDLKDKWKRILSKARDVNMLDDSPLF